MKKTILILMAVFLVIGASSAFAVPMVETIHTDFFFLGDFHIYDYASIVDFYRWCGPDGWLGGILIGTNPNLEDELHWSHMLPGDLGTVPPSEVDRAKIWIDGALIDTDNNEVAIEGVFDWDPLNHHFLDNSTYWLSDVDVPGFWNDGDIDVCVAAGEWQIRLDESILMMDYTPIPEPGTLVLLGSGLLGLGAFRFRRKK
jgi:hypothetical protein